MKGRTITLVLVLVLECLLVAPSHGALSDLQVPPNFTVSVFAEVPSPRTMTMSPSGVLYVASYSNLSKSAPRSIFALIDSNSDGIVDETHEVAANIVSPNGIAFLDGSLYVATRFEVLRIANIEADLTVMVEPEVVAELSSPSESHSWRYMVAKDGQLYIAIGAPCNVPSCPGTSCSCLSDPEAASIIRMNPDGTGREVYVTGIRNTVGMRVHPNSGELWFTENGRDNFGSTNVERWASPPEEINRVTQMGQHFGYPFCYGYGLSDNEFNPTPNDCSAYTPAVLELPSHVAPLGFAFYTDTLFPEPYRSSIFVAEHGSWNKYPPDGYMVSRLVLNEGGVPVARIPFLTGFYLGETCPTGTCSQGASCQDDYDSPYYCGGWGRPVDVQVWSDGSLLVSDDRSGVIWRVSYGGGQVESTDTEEAEAVVDTQADRVALEIGLGVGIGCLGLVVAGVLLMTNYNRSTTPRAVAKDTGHDELGEKMVKEDDEMSFEEESKKTAPEKQERLRDKSESGEEST